MANVSLTNTISHLLRKKIDLILEKKIDLILSIKEVSF